MELLHSIIYLTKIVVPKSLNEMKIISTEKSEDACLSDQLSKKRKKKKKEKKTKKNKQTIRAINKIAETKSVLNACS